MELKNISKSFPGVLALDNVDFNLKSGEIRALVGENGAGKTTLIKIICGVYKKDSGLMLLDKKPLKIDSVSNTRNYGISFVPREIEIMEYLNISENIFIGKYPSRFGFINMTIKKNNANKFIRNLSIKTPSLNTITENLSGGNKQKVSIAK